MSHPASAKSSAEEAFAYFGRLSGTHHNTLDAKQAAGEGVQYQGPFASEHHDAPQPPLPRVPSDPKLAAAEPEAEKVFTSREASYQGAYSVSPANVPTQCRPMLGKPSPTLYRGRLGC